MPRRRRGRSWPCKRGALSLHSIALLSGPGRRTSTDVTPASRRHILIISKLFQCLAFPLAYIPAGVFRKGDWERDKSSMFFIFFFVFIFDHWQRRWRAQTHLIEERGVEGDEVPFPRRVPFFPPWGLYGLPSVDTASTKFCLGFRGGMTRFACADWEMGLCECCVFGAADGCGGLCT